MAASFGVTAFRVIVWSEFIMPTPAGSFQHLNFIIQALGYKFVLQCVNDLMRAFCKALGVCTYQDMGTIKCHTNSSQISDD